MKTTKFVTALIIIFAIAFLSTLESCSREVNEGKNSSLAKENLLSSEGWVLKTAVVDYGTQSMDILALMDDADKDDLLYFKSDNNISRDAGALKLNLEDKQVEETGTWDYNTEDSKLMLMENGSTTEMKVVSLTTSELVVEFTEFDATLQSNINGKFTYTH